MANRNFLSYTSWINFGYILRGFHSHGGTPNSWKQTGLMENPVISWMLTGDALAGHAGAGLGGWQVPHRRLSEASSAIRQNIKRFRSI